MAGTSRSRNLFGEAFRSFRLDRRQARKRRAARRDGRSSAWNRSRSEWC